MYSKQASQHVPDTSQLFCKLEDDVKFDSR